MASSKRIGFFWGDDKITVVEFDKNAPLQVVSTPLGSKSNTQSPFSSNLTEEIQITAILQKMLHDSHITGGSFYVSLPAKEIILRSFIIPYVKPDEIQNAIKFEAKKYMPFDIQDLSFVYHTIPFAEGQSKRLQVIFFAARKEVLGRYERVFKQVNAEVSYCEPYMVSLTKALLFKKEIKPTDHLAFLSLDKNLGRICFIDQGIPQFIREFSISSSQPEDKNESGESMNTKIINEVGNSFDFYTRQFSGERIDQMLVSSDFIQKDLLSSLESELKVKITKFSPNVTAGQHGQSSDLDAIYAMGACVVPPIESLSAFNFLGGAKPKVRFQSSSVESLGSFKEIIYIFLGCLVLLAGIYFFYQSQLQNTRKQLFHLSNQEKVYVNEPIESLQSESQQNIDKLAQFKAIRMKSEIASIILRLASHLPQGTLLTELSISYDQSNPKPHVSIDMGGNVYKKDPDEQIETVNTVFSDLKHDKELLQYITSVSLVSLNREQSQGEQVTGFRIHCS